MPGAPDVTVLWYEVYNPTTGELQRKFELLNPDSGTAGLDDLFKRSTVTSDMSRHAATSLRVHQLGGDDACAAAERMATDIRRHEPVFDAADAEMKIAMLDAATAELLHRQSQVGRLVYLRAFGEEVVELYHQSAGPVDVDARARRVLVLTPVTPTPIRTALRLLASMME